MKLQNVCKFKKIKLGMSNRKTKKYYFQH